MTRHKQATHANRERWLVSYADFITLLFAFFVVLYASAQVDKRRVAKLAEAIEVGFQELGSFSSGKNQAQHSNALGLSKSLDPQQEATMIDVQRYNVCVPNSNSPLPGRSLART